MKKKKKKKKIKRKVEKVFSDFVIFGITYVTRQILGVCY